MHEDDEVCLCFHVSLRKIRSYLQRENPKVASLISECLSAGTGCGWCVPFLKHLHAQHSRSEPIDLRVSPEQYMKDRAQFRASGFHASGFRAGGPSADRQAEDDESSGQSSSARAE